MLQHRCQVGSVSQPVYITQPSKGSKGLDLAEKRLLTNSFRPNGLDKQEEEGVVEDAEHEIDPDSSPPVLP